MKRQKGAKIMAEQAAKPVTASQPPAELIEEGPTHEQIAVLAYSLWQARGCPEGTGEEDWFTAEKTLNGNAAA
jgi:hypothetical protein